MSDHVGVLLAIALLILSCVIHWLGRGNKKKEKSMGQWLKNNKWLIYILVGISAGVIGTLIVKGCSS